ncbi:hypothetical protein K470DRAFT_252544 [Piedraia hortae CBS 480.64]|uniref:LEA domain protein n=1 Tax=Piedraia hortae CBS 480.64 TaxID=1314780 RepID=A0A6A7BSS8_9PEZI|nr:hypothetical protein K470DRAFT_252544 [Piedraia hortae CBS 480.64]
MFSLIRRQPVSRVLNARSIHTTVIRQRSATDAAKDAAKRVDRTVSDAAIKGIDKTQELAQTAKEATGMTSGELKGKANELADQAKGTAQKLSGQAKGAANEMSRDAKSMSGDAQYNAKDVMGEAKGKAKEMSGEVKGKANELAGKAKGKVEEVKGKM